MSKILDAVYVATDSKEIFDCVVSLGGEAIMTSETHTTGIERVEEATRSMSCDVVVLINGDEAALDPEHIEASVKALLDSDAPTALLASRSSVSGSTSDFKVVVNKRNEAMYFSREDIPSPSRSGITEFLKAYHIISFRKEFLAEYVELEKTPMEAIEGHDHLRVLEHGIKVKIGIVDYDYFSVDTPQDVEPMCRIIRTDKITPDYLRITT